MLVIDFILMFFFLFSFITNTNNNMLGTVIIMTSVKCIIKIQYNRNNNQHIHKYACSDRFAPIVKVQFDGKRGRGSLHPVDGQHFAHNNTAKKLCSTVIGN